MRRGTVGKSDSPYSPHSPYSPYSPHLACRLKRPRRAERGGVSVTSSAGRNDVARPIWRGSLSFGLVAIPVQMHTAVRENRPKFRLLHAKDKSPIKYERVCQRDGKPVAWEDLVKGYEYRTRPLRRPDQGGLQGRGAGEGPARAGRPTSFPPTPIDDRYFDQPYYLLPDKGGEHAYAVFQKALAETGRIGIGKVVLREKQHLVGVESIERRLVLTMLRFADEVVDAAGRRT